MTHLLGPLELHHVSEVGCRGSRGSMNSQPDERDTDYSRIGKHLVPREKHLLGDEKFSVPHQALFLPLNTQTSPAHLNHLIRLHLLSPVNGYKEKCIANLSLGLSPRATKFKEKEYPWEISSVIIGWFEAVL